MPLIALLAPILGALLLSSALDPTDAADDKAAYVEGLADRGLHSLVVSAAEEFLDEYAEHQRSPTVRYRLADALFELDRNVDALTHWRLLADVSDFPWQAESQLRLGQTELALDNPVAAADALSALSQAGPNYLRLPARALLGEAQVRLENWDAAAAAFEGVLSLQSDGEYAEDARIGLAWADYRRGLTESAAQRTEALLSEGLAAGRRDEVAFLAGESLLELDRPDDAAAAYTKVREGPFRTGALRGLGFAHARATRPLESSRAFEELLARDIAPELAAEATLQLGTQLYQLGRHDEALSTLLSPSAASDASNLYWRGLALLALERPEDALSALEHGLAAGPDATLGGHLQGARGDALTRLGRRNDAAEAYAQAGSLAALHAAAVSLLNGGDPAAALERVAPLVERDPDDASLRLTRAEAFFGLGRYAEAEPDFELLLEDDVGALNPRAGSRLAWCHYLQGEFVEAAQLFERVHAETPDSAEAEEAGFMEGRALRQAEFGEQAVASWGRFVDARPAAARRDEALMGMAELLPGEAGLPALERLLAEHPDTPLRPAAVLELAERHSAAGRCERAEPYYAELVPSPDDPELDGSARYGLAWCQQGRGAHDEAATTLAPLVQPWIALSEGDTPRDPAAPEELGLAGLELLTWVQHERGQPEEAERCVRALIAGGAAAPRVLEAARTAASSWRAAERPERALALLGELAADDAVGADALVESVWVALDAQRPLDALDPMEAALARAPDTAAVAEAAFFLGEAFFTLGEHETAAALYAASARALEGTLTDKALYKEGFSHLELQDPTRAAAAFEALVSRFPESSLVGESLFLIGEARFRLDDFAAAAPPLQRLLEEHPGHQTVAKARFRLGLALAQIGEWDAAESALADLARNNPDFPQRIEAELWRARALAALGSGRAAQAAFERVIADDRSVLAARARLGLGRLHLDEGRVEAALSEFLKVAVLYGNPDEVAEALVMAGHSLERMGDTRQARARYDEALERFPDTTWAQQARERLQEL